MKARTLCLLAAISAIVVLALMDNWESLQQVKVALVCILTVIAGNLL